MGFPHLRRLSGTAAEPAVCAVAMHSPWYLFSPTKFFILTVSSPINVNRWLVLRILFLRTKSFPPPQPLPFQMSYLILSY